MPCSTRRIVAHAVRTLPSEPNSSTKSGRIGSPVATFASLNGLAAQVAFTLPLNLPLVGAATLYRFDLFYPAFMIALGTQYLPFVFLYGMRHFALLAAILVSGG